MLEVTSLAKSYSGQSVFSDISLVVDAGQIASLLGPNGAGKTTLLSIIAGLRRPDSGSVRICGADIATSRRQALAHLGMAPQETSIQLSLTGRENLTFFAELHGVHRRDLARRLDWVIDTLGVGPFVDKPTQHLSGGERRRIHTAAAIVGQPAVVLLDEPTVGADIESRQQLLEAVRHLAATGTAVLYTTHYLPEVTELNSRVLMLVGGQIIADGTVPELLAAHSGDVVELTFDGPVTRFAEQVHSGERINGVTRHRIDGAHDNRLSALGIGDLEIRGNVVRAWGDAITSVTAELLGTLGPGDPELLDINLVGGSLESVYLSLTGRHYNPDDPTPPAPPTSPEATTDAPRNGAAPPSNGLPLNSPAGLDDDLVIKSVAR